MIIELHLPLNEDVLLLAAWECNSEEIFNIFQKKLEFECQRYQYDIGVSMKHDATGNLIYILDAESEDFEHIQTILNDFALKNNQKITILVE